MKKSTLFLTTILILGVLIIMPSVLAAEQAAQFNLPALSGLGKMLSDGFTGFLRLLFGAEKLAAADELLFARALLSILVMGIVYSILNIWLFEGPNKSGLRLVVSILVSIIGVRILPNEFITLIMLPYGSLFVVISTFVPLVILFFFISTIPPDINGMRVGGVIRKAAWILAGVCFILLAISRKEAVGDAIWAYWLTAMFTLGGVLTDGQVLKLREYYTELADATRKERESLNEATYHLNMAEARKAGSTPGSAIYIQAEKDVNTYLELRESYEKDIKKIASSLNKQYQTWWKWVGVVIIFIAIVIIFYFIWAGGIFK